MLSVFETKDLVGLKADGILGLSPSSSNSKVQLFMDALFDSKKIDKKVFSFSITKTLEGSSVTFGGFDMSLASKDSKLTWNELINTNYWSLELIKAKIGDKDLEIETSTAIVDTGTSFLLVPTDDFVKITKHFMD